MLYRFSLFRSFRVVSFLFAVAALGTMQARAQAMFRVGVIGTIAGDGTAAGNSCGGAGSAATSSALNGPTAVAGDALGNLYLIDGNCILKRNAAGTLNTVAGSTAGGFSGDSGVATAALLNNPTALAIDSANNLYIADTGNNRIRKITVASGLISTIAGSGAAGTAGSFGGDGGAATSASLNQPQGVAVDSAGEIFIADTSNQRIREIATNGVISTIAGNGTAGFNGDEAGGLTIQSIDQELNQPQGIVLATGNVLYIADSGNSRIRRLNYFNGNVYINGQPFSGAMYTTVGTGVYGSTGDFGPAYAAELASPNQVALQPDGSGLYISDASHQVRFVDFSNSVIHTVAGTGSEGFSGDGGAAPLATIGLGIGIGLNSAGELAIADRDNLRVRRVVFTPTLSFPNTTIGSASSTLTTYLETAQAETITSFAISGSAAGPGEFVLSSVTGCSTGSSNSNTAGTICTLTLSFLPAFPGWRSTPLIADTSVGSFTIGLTGYATGAQAGFLPATPIPFIGNGTAGDTGDGGPVSGGELNTPQQLWANADGSLLIADSANSSVRKVSGGMIATVVTVPIGSVSAGVAQDPQGNIFIASSTGYGMIYKRDAASGGLSVYAGNIPGSTADGIDANNAILYGAQSLAFDSGGSLYIAEGTSNVVRRIDAGTHLISTVAGTGTAGDTGDNGQATSANLNNPVAIAIDGSNNLYIATQGENRVREVNYSTGLITTVAGNGTATVSGDGGAAIDAGVPAPTGVAVDAAGDLYITTGTSVRMVNAANGNISTISSGLTAPCCTALDASGNVYFSDSNIVYEMPVASPPSFTFNTTSVGSTSADSPQTATVLSSGNTALQFLAPSSGSNPSLSANFSLISTGSATCGKTSASGSPYMLAAGASCTFPVSFTPTDIGYITGSLVLTDNSDSTTTSSARQILVLSGNATGTPTTAKEVAEVSLSGLSVSYNGNTHTVTATTVPSGLAISITYNGSATAPSAQGSYAVVATVTDPNYTGNAAGTLVIAKATAMVTLGNLFSTYDGTPHVATANTTPYGLNVELTYNGSATAPSEVGTYTVTGTINDANYSGSSSGTFVISKKPATVSLSNLTTVYDGTPHSATATSNPANLEIELLYNGSATPPTGAGSYTVVATIQDSTYAGTATATFTITKSNATVTLGSLAASYDGNPHAATATTSPVGIPVAFTYNGSTTAPTNAGTYTVVGTINSPNYTGSATGTLFISSAAATITLGSLAATYDGNPHAATATTSPAGLAVTFTYNGSATVPVAIGSYTVAASFVNANCTGSATGTLVIAEGAATVTLGSLTVTYDGTAHAATATTVPAGFNVIITYMGSSTPPTAAGSYAVVATVNDTRYTGSAAGTLVIAKATASVSLSGLSATYDSNPHAASAATVPVGLATRITYNGSTIAPTSIGNYTVVATVNDANYSGSVSGTLVISGTTTGVTLGNLSATYDGNAHAATATTSPTGLAVLFTYNGSTTAPIAAGSYTVVASIVDPAYVGSAAGTLVVAKATPSISVTSDPNSISDGGSLMITVQVSAAAGGPPTGQVNFTDAGTTLATAVITNGAASSSVTLSGSGTHVIVAQYAGDTNFQSVTGNLAVTVSALNFTFTNSGASDQLVYQGNSISYAFALAPTSDAYPGPVTFALDGLPEATTYTFSSAGIAANAGPQTLTLTINTTNYTAQHTSPAWLLTRGMSLLAFLLLPFVGRKRPRGKMAMRLLTALLMSGGVAASCGLSGCGSGINGFVHNLQVTATSAGIQHTANVTLRVK